MRTFQNVMSPMRDGVKLACNIFLPDEEGAYPAILLRTPYIKEKIDPRDLYANYEELTNSGYAVIFQDARGTGMSEGFMDATGASEINDGYDTIEWVGAQPWCNGSVGTHGLSYFGYDQMAAAENNPPSLKALCPFQNGAVLPFSMSHAGTYDRYHLAWIMGRAQENLERWIPDEAAREKTAAELKDYLDRWDEVMDQLPAVDTPCARIEGLPQLQSYIELVKGIEDKSFMERAHRPIAIEDIKAPMLLLTGWFDGAKEGTLDNWKMATGNGAGSENRKLVIGPWLHGGFLNTKIEDMDFGEENSGAGREIRQLEKRWFDCWLKGDRDAIQDIPPVQYYVIGENTWRVSDAWPPKEAVLKHFYLHSQDQGRFGQLTEEAPALEPVQTYAYDPMKPVLSKYQDSQGRVLFADHTQEQQEREDILVYSTDPLSEPLRIVGKVQVKLWVSSDAPDTDFVARLYMVNREGRQIPLLNGITRCRFRNGEKVEMMEAGQVYCLNVDLGDIAVMVPQGAKIVLDITSSLYPAHDRNLNTEDRIGFGTEMRVAHNTVWHTGVQGSQLLLPVLDDSERISYTTVHPGWRK